MCVKKKKKKKTPFFEKVSIIIPIFSLLHNNIPIHIQKRDSSSKRVSLGIEKIIHSSKLFNQYIQK